MTFSLAGDKMMIIDSTFVDDAYRGEGLGKALLDSVVAQAREQGRKIVPLCPFAPLPRRSLRKMRSIGIFRL